MPHQKNDSALDITATRTTTQVLEGSPQERNIQVSDKYFYGCTWGAYKGMDVALKAASCPQPIRLHWLRMRQQAGSVAFNSCKI